MRWRLRKRNQQVDSAAQLVAGVGQVTIAATSLEWALTYLTGLIDNWDDDRHRKVFGSPGGPLREYAGLVSRLEGLCLSLPSFSALANDAKALGIDATRFLAERGRVVHSVWMAEIATDGQPHYEAWHARSDSTRLIVPAELSTLASELMECAAAAIGFAEAWQERSERDGWPVVPMSR